ncbi:uncharacterized mitochondrial protein AtMg00810-like [Rutidosis leptorrhynchoides]|uniref:uncharacterized mitochondrial protein AtMg00810-like n=1 Tax=Rutidosis leptorrhynchoides TaxID=125765 RepID=UPI003A99BE56
MDVQNGWSLYQLDVNNAFLYGDLVEDVYMDLPLGFYSKDEKRSISDYSLFVKKTKDVFLALLVYVDDIVVTGNDDKEIENFKMFLKTKFQIKDLGELKYFLGIEVLKIDGGVCFSQRKYCLELINEYGLLESKPVSAPLESNVKINASASVSDPELNNITEYQKIVGKLIYLTTTRPDISFSVQCLSRYMHAPLQSHFKIAVRILRYLKGSPGKGVVITKSGIVGLNAYVDADWGKCLASRKSVKQQAAVSRSSTESEYRAMAAVTCEILWIINILTDLGYKNLLPVNLFCDNRSAILIANNPISLPRGWIRVIHVLIHRFYYWDLEGNENSQFFHTLLKQRRNTQMVKVEGAVSVDGIRDAVWDCGTNKAPGPDDFSFAFIKKFWDINKEELVATFNYGLIR